MVGFAVAGLSSVISDTCCAPAWAERGPTTLRESGVSGACRRQVGGKASGAGRRVRVMDISISGTREARPKGSRQSWLVSYGQIIKGSCHTEESQLWYVRKVGAHWRQAACRPLGHSRDGLQLVTAVTPSNRSILQSYGALQRKSGQVAGRARMERRAPPREPRGSATYWDSELKKLGDFSLKRKTQKPN